MEIESEISLALAQWDRRNYKVAFELFFIFKAISVLKRHDYFVVIHEI